MIRAAQDRKLQDAERQRCEVWTRVMGYHRPVSEFNEGKKGEHYERVHFTESCASVESGLSVPVKINP